MNYVHRTSKKQKSANPLKISALTALDWQDRDLLQELSFLKKKHQSESKLMTVRDLPLIIGLNFIFHNKITSKMINFKRQFLSTR